MTQFRDTYLRFKDLDSVLAFFRRAKIKTMTGDRFDPREVSEDQPNIEDIEILEDIADNISRLVLKPNTVVIAEPTYDGNGDELTPLITDPNVWVVLRLIGDNAELNEGPGPRWTDSGITKQIRITGVDAIDRGARMSRMTFGPGGNSWVEVYNIDDLVALEIVPRVFSGGIL